MPRFFVDKEAVTDTAVTITGADARHIARALRMAVGDEITVADGTGLEYSVILTRIRDEECLGEITDKKLSLSEPRSVITLYMAYPKGDKLETVIQKAVELGAARIVPFESSRCIKKPKADKAEEKTSDYYIDIKKYPFLRTLLPSDLVSIVRLLSTDEISFQWILKGYVIPLSEFTQRIVE